MALALVVAVLGGGYAWTRTQYFVGVHDGEVAIFRGVPEAVGPVALSQVVERTGVAVDDIASQYVRERVYQTIHADDRESARLLVDEIGLRDDATHPGPGSDEGPDDSATTAAPTRTPSAETTTTAPATTGADG